MKFEYKIVDLEGDDTDADLAELTKLGKEGWELVSVVGIDLLVPDEEDEDEDAIETMHRCYLKRARPE